jgi:hypothetical protein
VYYVPEEERVPTRRGPARQSRRDDDNDRPELDLALAGAGNSRPLLLGLAIGAGSVLLVGVIVLAVLLARRTPEGSNPPDTANDPGRAPARPAGVADNAKVTVERFRTIKHTASLAEIEALLGPAAALTPREMRATLSHKDCQLFCKPPQADAICNSPKVGFYQWKNGDKVIHLAITPNQEKGIVVCLVFVGPAPNGGGIKAEFAGNLTNMAQVR